DLVLPHARAGRLHRGNVAENRDIDGLPHARDLVGVLYEAHRVRAGAQVPDVAPREGELADPLLVARGRVEGDVQGAAHAQQRGGQRVIERVGGEDTRHAAETARRAVRSEPQAGPALLERGAGRQEQHGLGSAAARDEQEPRVLSLELGEVEERVALAKVVVLDVAAPELAFVRGEIGRASCRERVWGWWGGAW